MKFYNYSGCTIKDQHTLIVCGGIDTTLRTITNQCFEYNFFTNELTELPSMLHIRYTFPIVYHKQKVYSIGGRIYGPDNR